MRLLLLLLLPFMAAASDGTYKYKGIRILENGVDNFNVSQYNSERRVGTITVEADLLKIDKKEFRMKPTQYPDVFKVKGGAVKFVYENSTLTAVQLYQYNQAYKFIIVPAVPVAAK